MTTKQQDSGPGLSEAGVSQYTHEHNVVAGGSPSFNIINIAERIWRLRKVLVIGTILGFAISLLAISALRYLTVKDAHSYLIRLTFKGIEEGTYPNGTPFYLSDIISPAILDEVYNRQNIGETGMEPVEFSKSMFVTAYTDERELIQQKYTVLFDKRKSSLADIENNQRAMSDELEAASLSNAQLRLVSNISTEKAQNILLDIAQTWAKYSIGQRNVLEENFAEIQDAYFNPKSFQGLNPENKIKTVNDRINKFDEFIDSLESSPAGMLITDEQSNMNSLLIRDELQKNLLKLREVAASWSSDAAKNPNSKGLAIGLNSGMVFQIPDVKNTEYVLAVDYLENISLLLQSNIRKIETFDFGKNATDPLSNLTIVDIEQLLGSLKENRIDRLRTEITYHGVTKDKKFLQLYYREKVAELKRERQELGEKVNLINSVAFKDRQLQSDGSSQFSGNSSRLDGNSISPQLSTGFIDKLISMGDQKNDGKFRRNLIEESVRLGKRQAEINSKILRYSEHLALIASIDGSNNKISSDPPIAGVELIARITSTAKTMAEYADATVRISRRLRYAQDIHAILDNEPDTTDGEETDTSPKNSDRVSVDYYLNANNSNNTSLEELLKDLQGLSGVANRLRTLAGSKSYGVNQRLYRPLSSIEKEERQLFGMKNILLIVMFSMLGFLLSLVVGYFMVSRKTT